MRAPIGLVAVALALWGWSVGHLALGLLLGAAYEVSHIASPSPAVAARLPMVMRACGLAVLLLLGYVIATQSPPGSLYTWLRWLPLVLLPLAALGQLAGGVRESHALLALGRPPDESESDEEIDVTHAYAAIALAAAGTGTGAQPWLYAGYAVVVGWALLARLPRRRILVAAVMFVAAAASGHAIHTGIWLLQGQVEELSSELLQDFFTAKANPFKERTRIGDLGRIKLSDRILMRVEVEGARPASLLLRESAFELYRSGEWRAARPTGRPVENNGGRWTLSQGGATQRLTVRRSIPGGEGLLPLPAGTRAVESLPAQSLEVFPTGTVRVHGSPRFVAFTAAYDPAAERDATSPADLDVPGTLSDALDRTIAANNLRRATPAQTVEAVRAFFDANFAYSLDLGERTRTLADFLLRDRKGHCEYFASSTAMLLRALGIPARYAAGYSVQEYSNLERAFVVRNRHAHAWVTAWVDGRWIEVDTTPARWADFEGEAARSFFAPLLDGLSWLFEKAVQAWIELGDEGLARAGKLGAMIVLAAGALGASAWLWRKTRRPGRRRARPDAIARAWSAVEKQLARTGQRRGEAETVREWMRRLAADPAAPWAASLAALAKDYYRVRFDPAAAPEEAARFVDSARRWRLGAGPS